MAKSQILLKPTCIIVTNYILGSCRGIEDQFKIYDARTMTWRFLGLKYDPDNRYLYLPRGFDIWYIQNCLNIGKSDIIYIDPNPYRYMNRKIDLKYLPRDDEQAEAVQFTMCMGKYERNNSSSQLSLNLNTGKGKTYVSVFTMVATGIKSIVIATIKDWLVQWKNAILEYTTLMDNEVIIIDGSNDINMMLSGNSNKVDNGAVFLVTHSTIKSFGDTYGWNRVDELFAMIGIGNMFIDEAHKNFDNICNINYAVNVYKTYFITATPARSSVDENRIYQLGIKNIPNIDLFDPLKDPHTHYIALKFNSNPTREQYKYCKSRMYGLDRNRYISYLLDQPRFYDMLHIVMSMVRNYDNGVNSRFLFYIGTNEGILKVYKWLTYYYPETNGMIGIYTTLVPNKETEKHKKYILSTTKSAGEAADFKNLTMTIVLAEPFKSEVIARQTLGRTRGDNTIYLDLVDMGFSKLKEWHYSKREIFERYALTVKSFTIKDVDIEERVLNIEEDRGHLVNRGFSLCDDRFEGVNDYSCFEQ